MRTPSASPEPTDTTALSDLDRLAVASREVFGLDHPLRLAALRAWRHAPARLSAPRPGTLRLAAGELTADLALVDAATVDYVAAMGRLESVTVLAFEADDLLHLWVKSPTWEQTVVVYGARPIA